MLRVPIEHFNRPQFDDEDVIKAWKWMKSFIPGKEWEKRKVSIEKRITVEFRTTPPFSDPLTEGTLLAIKDDVAGWYLYLVDMLINEPHKYEHFQGARVVPIFKRLGINLDIIQSIEGINKKIKELVVKRKSEADALLFEILTALLWARNGYEVAFLPEKKNEKSPDLIAKKNGETWNIECKRQSKTSDYTYRENAKRQKMISYISKMLLERNILLNIVFHVELETLPDTFLKDLLEPKLRLAIQGKIVSNEQVDIDLSFVDLSAIQQYLDKYDYLKYNSPMLHKLIGKKPVDHKGFTCGIYAQFFRFGEGEVNNLYISDIANAFGVYCTCDAKEGNWAKARDIKNQLFKALKQFNSKDTAIIHVGMETFDGPEVESTRLRKIAKTIEQINPAKTKLRWIFCHFFQSYAPPNQDWVFDETISEMSSYLQPISPLQVKLMIVPEDADTIHDNFHWDRQSPY